MILLLALWGPKIKILNIFYFRWYIILLVLIYDLYTIINRKEPCSWNDFYNNKSLFTWYSGFYHIDKSKFLYLIFWLFISKIIITIQIIVSFDLIIVRIFRKKILYIENYIYICFIIIPWICINIIIEKIINLNFEKNDIKAILLNFLFINLWWTNKTVVSNAIKFVESWENWKEHSYNHRKKPFKFLRLTQKYCFNELNKKYSYKFTYKWPL